MKTSVLKNEGLIIIKQFALREIHQIQLETPLIQAIVEYIQLHH